MSMNTVLEKGRQRKSSVDASIEDERWDRLEFVLTDIAHGLHRIERVFDEAVRAYLDAKFSHGDGRAGDRWARRRR